MTNDERIATDTMKRIVADLADRRGCPSDLERGEDWAKARRSIVEAIMMALGTRRPRADISDRIRRPGKTLEFEGMLLAMGTDDPDVEPTKYTRALLTIETSVEAARSLADLLCASGTRFTAFTATAPARGKR